MLYVLLSHLHLVHYFDEQKSMSGQNRIAKTDDESHCSRAKENTTGRKLLGNRRAEQLLSLNSDSCDSHEEKS